MSNGLGGGFVINRGGRVRNARYVKCFSISMKIILILLIILEDLTFRI